MFNISPNCGLDFASGFLHYTYIPSKAMYILKHNKSIILMSKVANHGWFANFCHHWLVIMSAHTVSKYIM